MGAAQYNHPRPRSPHGTAQPPQDRPHQPAVQWRFIGFMAAVSLLAIFMLVRSSAVGMSLKLSLSAPKIGLLEPTAAIRPARD